MKRLLNGSSFYKKLLLSYFVILLIFIALSPFVYNYARRLTRENELRFTTTTVGYVKERFDKEVSSMKEMAYVLLDTENEYHKKHYGNEVLGSMNIVARLRNVANSLAMIENCYIYDGENGALYSSDGAESLALLQKYKPAGGDSLLAAIESRDGFFYVPIIKPGGEDGILFVAGDAYGGRDICVLMPIKTGWVSDIYKNDYRIGVFMIAGSDGTVIAGSEPDRVHTSIDADVLDSLNDGEKSFFMSKSWFAFSKSAQCDWYYIVETDKNLINATANKIRVMQIFVMLATLLMGLVIIFVSSKKIYSPINKLASRFSEEKSSDELEALENTLLKLISENEKYRRETDYLQLFNRSEANTLFENETLCAIVIRGFNISRYIKELNSAEFGTDNDSFRFFAVADSEIIGLVRGIADIGVIRGAMLAIKKHFGTAYGISLLIGVGNLFDGSENFSFSLNNARYAMDFGIGSDGVCVFDNKMSSVCSIVIDKDYTERRLLRAVEKSDFEEIESTLARVFEDNAELPNMFKFGLSIILVNIYNAVGSKTGCHIIDYELLMRELKNEYDNGILKAFFVQLFIGMVLEQAPDGKGILKKSVIEQCIAENFSDMNFDLGALADKLGYSTVYMTSLFKKTMGVSFMQYLLDYRIEKAKELLVTTGEKIEWVAAASGFGTYNNFARAFRKKTGISPGEYRKNS